MSNIKLLLYCTKTSPYLLRDYNKNIFIAHHNYAHEEYHNNDSEIGMNLEYENQCEHLNGKIIAECDFEVGDIHIGCREKMPSICYLSNRFWTMEYEEILEKSCLTDNQLDKYLSLNQKNKCSGYMIKIKNLNIFDKPKYLSDYNNKQGYRIYTSPQNMCYAYDNIQLINKFIIISIKPE